MNNTQSFFPPTPPHMVGVGDRGRAIYAEKIRPLLTDEDKGKYLIINVETGEWIMDADYEMSARMARERFNKQRQFHMRVGYRVLASLRPGLNTELAEW